MAAENVDVVLSLKDKLSGGLNSASKKVGGLGDSFGKALKAGAIVGTTALVGLGAAALKIGSDFEKARNIIIAGTGATGDALKNLEKDMKSVLKTVPQGSGEVATALASINTEFATTGGALQSMTKQALTVSRVLGEDVNGVIMSTADAMKVFGDDADNFNKRLDQLTVLSQATNVPVATLAGQITTLGPVMKNAGFDMETTAAIIGKLAQGGLDATQIMPALNNATRKLASEGVKDMNTGLVDVIAKIKNATSTTDQLNIASEYFGARGAQVMLNAIQNGSLDFQDLADQMANSTGAVDRMGKESLTLGQRFAILKNKGLVALEPLATKVLKLVEAFIDKGVPAIARFAEGLRDRLQRPAERLVDTFKDWYDVLVNQIIPPVLEFADSIRNRLQPPLVELADWFRNNKDAMQAAGVAIGAVLVTAFTAWAVSAGAAAVATIAAAAPVIALVAVIAALAAGIFLLIKHWDEIKERYPILEELRKRTVEAFQAIVGWIQNPLIPTLQSIATTVQAVVTAVVGFFRSNWGTITSIVQPVINQFKANIQVIVDVLTNLIAFFNNVFHGDWKGAWDNIKNIVDAFKTFFEDTIKNAIDFLGTVGGLMLQAGKDLMGKLKEGVESIWTGSIKPFFQNLPGNAKDAIIAGIGLLYTLGKDLLGFGLGLGAGMVSQFLSLKGYLATLPGKMVSAIGDVGRLLWDVGKQIIQGLWDGLKDKWKDVEGWLGGIGSRIKSLKGPIEQDAVLLRPQGEVIMQGFGIGLQEGVRKYVDPVLKATSDLVGQSMAIPGGGGATWEDYWSSQVAGATQQDIRTEMLKSGKGRINEQGQFTLTPGPNAGRRQTYAEAVSVASGAGASYSKETGQYIQVNIDKVYATDSNQANTAGEDISYALVSAARRRGLS